MKKTSSFNYQVQIDGDKKPWDLVTELTHTIWETITHIEGLEKTDPHRWSSLFTNYRQIFINRLVRYEDCGSRPECFINFQQIPGDTLHQGRPKKTFYTLKLNQNIDRFIHIIAYTTYRNIRTSQVSHKEKKDNFILHIQKTIKDKFGNIFILNGFCEKCPARLKHPEHRIWTSKV